MWAGPSTCCIRWPGRGGGVVSAKRGDYIYFMSLEDLEGILDVVIFGGVYRRHRSALSTPGPFVIEGVVELYPARVEPVIRAERVWRLE